MREIRKSGSEGGKPYGFPTPIKLLQPQLAFDPVGQVVAVAVARVCH